jgi:copper homeostasis protein
MWLYLAMKKKLEVIATEVAHVFEANRLGVDRIELCSALSADGLSPSSGLVEWAVKNARMPIMVMIRPREGGFVYSSEELEIMLFEIEWAKQCGAMGIVVGILNDENEVNIESMKRVVQCAYPMEVTFHRAFDVVRDPMKSLEEIIELGCTRILTSGQKSNCIEGKSLIHQLQEAAGDRIVIVAGAGINSETINAIQSESILEYHMSGLKRAEPLNEQEIIFGGKVVSRVDDIATVLNKLKQ